MSEKSDLRARLKALGKEIPGDSGAMTDIILKSREYQNAETILAFYGVPPEPDTLNLLKTILNDGKTLCLPKTYGKGIMDARVIASLDDIKPGRYNIPEPTDGLELASPERIDLALVPALAFDTHGNRLGHGAGYYDRYLAGFSGFTLGLCFEKRLMERVPTDSFDLPVKAIATDSRLIYID